MQSISLTFIGKAVGPSATTGGLTQGLNLCLFVSPALAGRFFTTSSIWEAQMPKGNDNFTVGLDSRDSQLVRVQISV